MSVNHRRPYVGMAQKFLDGANVGARLEQVCGEQWRKVWQLAD